jgi:hypothetical protein
MVTMLAILLQLASWEGMLSVIVGSGLFGAVRFWPTAILLLLALFATGSLTGEGPLLARAAIEQRPGERSNSGAPGAELAGPMVPCEALSFAPPVFYDAASGPTYIAAADFNGDSNVDLATANRNANSTSVLLGNGNGTFQPANSYPTGQNAAFVAVGHFNGDARPDLAVANAFSNTVSILIANGNGTMQPAVNYAAGPWPLSIAVGDFNQDTYLDVAVANSDPGSISGAFTVLLGNGNGTFQPSVSHPLASRPMSVAAADFNHDGRLDLVMANIGTVTLLLGNGNGTFQDGVNYPSGSAYQVTVWDFNRDTYLDLATPSSSNVVVLLGNSSGGFGAPAYYPVANEPTALAVGDLDEDGNDDMAVTRLNAGLFAVLLGNGDGTFRAGASFSSGYDPFGIVAADLNEDTHLDLAVANTDNPPDNVSIVLNACVPVGATLTPTSSPTTTRTPIPCPGNYAYATSSCSIVPGNVDIGNHCDNCLTNIVLPFPFQFYEQTYNSANVSSNGNLQFVAAHPDYPFACLPIASLGPAILPYWEDLRTDVAGGGIFTSISGIAPNRIFNIEWRTLYVAGSAATHFELRLHEGSSTFDFVYGQVDLGGNMANVGVQDGATRYVQYECASGGISQGLCITFTYQTCATPTPTVTGTPPTATPTRTGTSTPTYTRSRTATVTGTNTPILTSTITPTATSTCEPTWRTVSSPAGGANGALGDVAVISPSDVWVVGRSDPQGRTLSMHWDGQEWTVIPSPNFGTRPNALSGVVAVASDDVWAIGAYQDSAARSQPLVIHWDGSQWAMTSLPPLGTPDGYLADITAAAPNDIWAVGFQFDPSFGGNSTLTMHWNGAKWSIVPSPDKGRDARLYGVTAVASNDVWAVGRYLDSGNHQHTLVEHWDGSQWAIVASPDPSDGGYIDLFAVDAVSVSDIWAVGTYGNRRTLTLHWNGQAWSIVSSPNPGIEDNALQGVFALSSNNVWAVGFVDDTISVIQYDTLLEHWDGTGWSVVASPNISNRMNFLSAIAGVSGTDLWSVGHANDPDYDTNLTLMLRYTDPCATVTPTPIRTGTPTITPTITSSTLPGTRTVTSTATPCSMPFGDVQPTDYFYDPVHFMYCHSIISGYGDNTFRPYNNTTRGQLSKIAVLAEGWTIDTSGGPHFSDVPTTNPFYSYIETAYGHHIISGYSDGTFRWGNNVTRGQLSKIIVGAEAWATDLTGAPHFSDVPPTNPFYEHIETAYAHGIISGYADGTFRPGNDATRGQIAKIAFNAVTQP